MNAQATPLRGRLAGKVALVSGGGSGIGDACARTFAAEGAAVVVADLREDAAVAVVERISASGGDAIAAAMDVTCEADWERLMHTIRERYGRLDVTVNSAGTNIGRSDPAHTPLEDWRRVMAVNLDGVFLGTKHSVALMSVSQPVSGSIINISSILGLVATADNAAYSASKGGVRLYSKSVALSCGQRGLAIRVNSIHPGYIDTPLLRQSLARMPDPDRARADVVALHPIGHIGEPEDIAWGALYLASDESRFVTGSELVIDGGYTCR